MGHNEPAPAPTPDSEYQVKRKSAIKSLRWYLIGNTVFVLVDIVTILAIPGYSFPKNFWAIWPILGWGAIVVSRFIALRQYK